MEGELRRLRESHSEVTAEATRFRNLHVKGIMEYSQRKTNFKKELEEHKKRASDRTWTQAAKISSLIVELSAMQERISQLEGSSSCFRLGPTAIENGQRRSATASGCRGKL